MRHTGTVTRPRYQSAPYRPSDAQRRLKHGKLVPLKQYRDPTAKPLIVLALLIALFFAVELLRGVL